jgi:hypothetical protein
MSVVPATTPLVVLERVIRLCGQLHYHAEMRGPMEMFSLLPEGPFGAAVRALGCGVLRGAEDFAKMEGREVVQDGFTFYVERWQDEPDEAGNRASGFDCGLREEMSVAILEGLVQYGENTDCNSWGCAIAKRIGDLAREVAAMRDEMAAGKWPQYSELALAPNPLATEKVTKGARTYSGDLPFAIAFDGLVSLRRKFLRECDPEHPDLAAEAEA